MLKNLRVYSLIFSYLVAALFISWGKNGPERATRRANRTIRKLVRVLNIRVLVRGKPALGMVVANHVSYVDILSILSAIPCRFITFTELRGVIGVGLIARMGQTLFVHRSRPSQVKKDILEIKHAMRGKVPVVLFPEGESFDGTELRPFKSSLIESAIATGVSVQPLCIRYLEIDGEEVTLANRDRIFFYGDMQLLPQLISITKLKSLTVELIFGEPIATEGRTRKEIAYLARTEILKHHLPIRK